jgi:NAD dependent epimerase/dehydratase family enzyme
MHWIVSKFVPCLLTEDQRGSHVAICQELLDCIRKDENFPKRIITGNETWFYEYDVEMKMQSSQWVGKKFVETKKGMVG